MENEYKIPKGYELRNLDLNPADNGGYIVNFTEYKPDKSYKNEVWNYKTYAFGESEKDKAVNFFTRLAMDMCEAKRSMVYKPTGKVNK